MNGRAVLVTGGSSGIGFTVAKQLAAQGATVAVTGRSLERGEAAARELREISPGAFFLQAESADAQQCERAAEEAARRMGRIDVLVSSGAEHPVGPMPFAQMSAEQIESGFRSRILARILPLHAAIPHLRTSGRGCAVLITTDAARHPTPGESVIGGAGAAILLMTKVLARELSRDRIRVNGVAMTITSGTPGWDRVFGQQSFATQVFEKAVARFPSGRAPTAQEVAQAVCFLAGDEALQITGQTLSVNGGLSFGGW